MKATDKAIIKNADENIVAVLEPELKSLIKGAQEAGFETQETIDALKHVVEKVEHAQDEEAEKSP
jgi:hypothetical protein